MNKLREAKWIGIAISLSLIILGIVCVAIPVQVQLLLNTLAGITLLVLGATGLLKGFSLKSKSNGGTGILLFSIITVIFGITILLNPTITMFMVGLFVSVLAIFVGFDHLLTGLDMNKKVPKKGSMLIANGIINVLFGVFMAWNTFATMAFVLMIIGVYLIVAGIGMISSIISFQSMVSEFEKQMQSTHHIEHPKSFDYDIDVDDYTQEK